MAAVDTPESGIKHKKGKRRKPERIGVKIDRKAKYRYMVDIIDQLQFAELNRFSLAPLLPEEKQDLPL